MQAAQAQAQARGSRLRCAGARLRSKPGAGSRSKLRGLGSRYIRGRSLCETQRKPP